MADRFSMVNTATSGAELVAAQAGVRIRVKALALISSVATANIVALYNGDYFCLGATGSGVILDADAADGGKFVLPWSPAGWFETDTIAEALKIELSAATVVTAIVVWEPVA